jgi:nuclease S1
MSCFKTRKSRILLASALFGCLLIPQMAWPWGRLAHRATAKMAEERLTPAALAAVHDLLGPGVTLADISSWADEQREVPRAASWHYVNVPITESRYDPKFCQTGGCIVSKIEDFKRLLRDRKAGRVERQQALKFLVHLITDLHQPLHVGDTGSRGGNLIQVRFYSVGSNLHRVWDVQIMERHTQDERVWLWDFDFLANPKAVKEWSKGTPEDWATESLQVAKEAYCLPGTRTVMKSGTRLGDEYYRMALPIIQKQLAKAGIRTAWTLNEIFR